MSTARTPTTSKTVRTIKRLGVGIPIVFLTFAILRVFLGDMAAAAIALVVMSVATNLYFAD